MRVLALVFGLVASIVAGSSASAEVPKTDAEREAAVKSLHWRDGELLHLPISRGTLQAPDPFRQVLGADAGTLYEAANGIEAPTSLEAIILDKQGKTLVYYEKMGHGFVHLNDWDEVDADAMLKSIAEATEAGNRQRKETGVSALHVMEWLERPHLDRSSSTVRWAFEVNDDDSGPAVNAVAIVLGRDGFEKLTWAGPKSALRDGLLNTGVSSFNFPAGGRPFGLQGGRQGRRVRHRRTGRHPSRREGRRQARRVRRARRVPEEVRRARAGRRCSLRRVGLARFWPEQASALAARGATGHILVAKYSR
jgi:uncharacterized membrane-anchored protein